MRPLLTSFLALVCLFLSFGAMAKTTPNIVFILADDLGIGDINCDGGKRCLIDTLGGSG